MSKPYYNFFLHSFGLPLLLLMGIGPLVAWRRASLRALGKTFLFPAIAANPFISFFTVATASGTIEFKWTGDNGFSQTESANITVE